MQHFATRPASPPALLLLFCCAMTCGCAVVSSTRTDVNAPSKRGVAYYLPKKDIVVSFTVGEGTSSLQAEATAAYPDLEHRFLARYRETLIGQDTLSLGVTESGLLTSTNADFTSQLPEILKNVAKAAGAFAGVPPLPGRAAAAAAEEEPCRCVEQGVYSKRIDLSGMSGEIKDDLCGFQIKVKRMGRKADGSDSIDLEEGSSCHRSQKGDGKVQKGCDYTGLFYRQLEPYSVEIDSSTRPKACGAKGMDLQYSAVLFSPTNARLEMLPVRRGLFANANSAFTFTDGSPTLYQQTRSGEIAAITALPAELASAYFESIGSMFQLRTEAVNNASAYDKAVAGLLLQQEKTRACTAALASKDQAAIDANCN